MKMKKLGSMLLMTVLCCLLAGNAFAENRAGAFTVSPMIGGFTYEGDQGLTNRNRVNYGIGLGYNFSENWAVEGLFNFISDGEMMSTKGGLTDVDGLLYRLEALYHFMPESRLVPYFAIGGGNIVLDPAEGPRDDTFLAGYGAGLKYFMTEDVALRLDARHLIGLDEGIDESNKTDNNFLYTAGVTFQFGGKEAPAAPRDSDGDGVTDDLDRCPDTPRGVAVDGSGCPLDSDRDGVYDYLDKCPETPRGATVDANGCPLDSDGDGVYDYQDKCPGTPKGVAVDSRGCPPDSDGDGVADYLDKCPNTPRGAAVDAKGCPLDSDGDGVFDYLDKCPGTARGIAVDEKGCPLTFTLHLEFDTNKADIRPAYHPRLKEAADFIAKYRGYQILVGGHTDDRGASEYNQGLSLRRAESVRKYLIEKFGVDGKLLNAQGFGEDRPVAGNNTAEGRQRNRRVEVSVVAPN